ncbi:hypothetical protein CHH83_15480 [Bacillus sp. 7586-K]|uniref:reverse transcriptase-like protein n=1 Tax=Metabacillus niabensis TaxID=324854 RepID=UPI000BA6F465|nr:hypothetical protein CHH83_15480 [Bacillus sp. 7586-K]
MNYKIEWTYETKRKHRTNLYTDYLSLNEAITFADDFVQTGRAKELSIFSEDGGSWTLKELKKFRDIVKDEPHDVIAYFDGGYQKDTRIAGFGVVIYYTQSGNQYRIRMNERVEGLTSNNEAEYAACLFLVNLLEENEIIKQKVKIKGDSQVVLNQLAGEWPCYEAEFTTWLDKIENKLKECQITPKYEPVSRKENNEADKLATQAINGVEIRSKMKLNGEADENE